MFNYYLLEKMTKEKEKKEKHRDNSKYIQKRDILVERYRNFAIQSYRERVVKFIEKMAVNPIRENDQVYESVLNQSLYKSKMLGDYTVLSKHQNDKERLQETLANASNQSHHIHNKISIQNSKHLLPDLSAKTHFKGATMLMSDLREIDGVYSDAKLKSRFRVLERNLSKTLSKASHSVEPGQVPKSNHIMFANDDQSIQRGSQNDIVLKGITHRSRVNDNFDNQIKSSYKSHVKRMTSLKKHVNINSKAKLGEVSDYGTKRNLSTHPRNNIDLRNQTEDNIMKLKKRKSSISKNFAKNLMSKTITLDKKQDSSSTNSERPAEYNESDIDITEITKNVLEK